MQKDSCLSLRIDSGLKNDVEEILSRLGITMTAAIVMYFNQIQMMGGIPFDLTIKNQALDSIKADF